LTVILLMAQLCTHMHQLPSFLGVNRVDTTHGLMLSLIYLLLSSLSTWHCKIWLPCRFIQ